MPEEDLVIRPVSESGQKVQNAKPYWLGVSNMAFIFHNI